MSSVSEDPYPCWITPGSRYPGSVVTSFANLCYTLAVITLNGSEAMNVSLTPELEKYVRNKVASGLYNNASELIREALRLFLARDSAPIGRPTPEPVRKDEVLAKLAALKKPLRKQHRVSSLALFGSVARGVARADSDIDVLIDVAPDAQFSLIDLVSVKEFLEEQLGRKVDVVTKDGLNPAIRARVLREAERVF